jgi:hypothetical protein
MIDVIDVDIIFVPGEPAAQLFSPDVIQSLILWLIANLDQLRKLRDARLLDRMQYAGTEYTAERDMK